MEAPIFNRTVLMSDAENYRGVVELNLYTDEKIQPDLELAKIEHAMVKTAFESAGINVIQVKSPIGCQDGIYTANWAFCSGDTAVLSRLPNVRRGEEGYAQGVLRRMGKRILKPIYPRYSGQGDTLVCGDTLFLGKHYRTDPEIEGFMRETFDYNVVSIQTVPAIKHDVPVTNKVSGWPDSYYYDIDLAMGIVRPPTMDRKGIVAWCPEAFMPESQDIIAGLDFDLIEIDEDEATNKFASNFVSTGHTVIMGKAPKLEAAIKDRGLETITLETKEINKGGGFIRCIALTLDND